MTPEHPTHPELFPEPSKESVRRTVGILERQLAGAESTLENALAEETDRDASFIAAIRIDIDSLRLQIASMTEEYDLT